ncbi:MAG: hypothetical protein LBD30_02140 [Verrucomicrobiales bacterium]|jgi:hypothetical protein|nr:hypothetical protein [Verrucomicrobiales bacterium]
MQPSLQALRTVADGILPRVLTQVCRDPNSPAHGCFDRNWWHYKMRDFPSIILQQGAYALWLAARLADSAELKLALKSWSVAGAVFWNQRAGRRGAFEEYYPWEEGYPPLAFSTLAVMKLVADGAVSGGMVRDGARVATRQLLRRFEPRAANQQVAGLAALAWLGKNYPGSVSAAEFARLADRTLALQSKEGWFMEYDGPDLGYLSVTMDCLWDLYDATGDGRFIESARRAAEFIRKLVVFYGGSIGMHNARNTDYLATYGLARLGLDDCFGMLFSNADDHGHFFAAVDDRYWCHYLGHSVLRTLLLTSARGSAENNEAATTAADCDFAEAGYQLVTVSGGKLFLSPLKGGIFSLRFGNRTVVDLGWMVSLGKKSWVSHWWSPAWTWHGEAGKYVIQGRMAPHREMLSSPWKHLALRALSFCLGGKIIALLKNRLIFKNSGGALRFERTVIWSETSVTVSDRIFHVPPGATVGRAPRSSKRHVASADSWHGEDAALNQGVTVKETHGQRGDIFSATTEYFINRSD